MATIKPIEGRSVHQIQSGQVIVDLCSVVKELVENSLDAGATSIDVRFKNQGLESIEVQDNGDGISPHNYETLALKHHTSKLSTYSDLTTLQTFGFRGEALSSLCALSCFSVITCLAKDAPKGTKLEFEVSGKLKGGSVVAAQKGTTVIVENLFNNLPVRRQELQRNIKREWNRVVGVLGQYACVQTGIKFSVSQQAGKGKKTTLFSTKGNQSTRENIVNVFGAKTLTALITLDLNLELEPTSGPSQRWSTQEDGGKKNIRIIGHISRPASGEGRQTPDRQMFFVNARPCGLPQVSKAFNEVYKTYNGSQSPFIFANIELDTHMYDVNVSPDKRTILLHDQNRMLENLKVALTELFESQDYTVPISQLPAQKQSSYKQLTIARGDSVQSNASHPSVNHEDSVQSKTSRDSKTPAAESTEGEDSEDETRSSRREQSTDEEDQQISYNPKFRRGAVSQEARSKPVSRESMGKDRESVSLISNWLGKKTEDRVDQKDQSSKSGKNNEVPEGLSKEKQKLVAKLGKESEQQARDLSENLDSSVATSQSTTVTPSQKPPVPVPHFDEREAENDKPQNAVDDMPSSLEPETPIPALPSPAKGTPSIADMFSSTARTYRGPAEIATITIGDHMVTSSIGTPCPKRPRIDSIPSTSCNKRPSQVPGTALLSFGKSLSQRFGAPGTALQTGTEEEEIDDEVEEVPLSPQLLESSLAEGSAEIEIADLEETEDTVMQSTTLVIKHEEEEGAYSSALLPSVREDGEYLDEGEKKAREDAKVQEMIQDAEEAGHIASQENAMKAKIMLKGGSKKKDATLNLVKSISTSTLTIGEQFRALEDRLSAYQTASSQKPEDEALDSDQAEEKLSLTISKADFAKMRIIGQFNLGFILASRASESDDGPVAADDLFIIDQHASDEKYNFERLYATTIVQSQPLVQPKTLDLTALEEEIVMENLSALETNGFIVTVDESGEAPVGRRCQVISLPTSRETTFSLMDLAELIALLADHPPGAVPRPSKVRKMFAMRACRSSIMIGKTLTHNQMGKVVKHLGELDKPWNCPHGRPTMRHLCGLGVWDEMGWKEGLESESERLGTTDWAAYVRPNMGDPGTPALLDDEDILVEER
ncbi:DNA mismatch repair protein MutL [Stipitochalara longipes BDJ]|nr:DNA mismatch repair protein MutL [Stipitochalara longipes BDJ]